MKDLVVTKRPEIAKGEREGKIVFVKECPTCKGPHYYGTFGGAKSGLENSVVCPSCREQENVEKKVARQIAYYERALEEVLHERHQTNLENRGKSWKGEKWDLTLDIIRGQLNGQGWRCKHSGFPLTHDNASIDRIENKLGYLKDNFIVCIKGYNMMRASLTIEEFYKFCKDVNLYQTRLNELHNDVDQRNDTA